VFAVLAFALGKPVDNDDALSARADTIVTGSPAAAAGMQNGDVIVRFADQPVESFGALKALVGPRAGETHPIVVNRGGEEISLTITIGSQKQIDQTGIETSRGILGVSRTTKREERVIERLNPLEALGEGAARVWSIIASTGAYIGNIFSGKASAEHIAGPIGIFNMSGQVSQSAVSTEANVWDNILSWLVSAVSLAAILSVAVGIVNLLPVPVLDGGHLMFYAAEAVMRRPLSAKTQEYGYRAGMALLLSLFLFATWNDLNRVSQDLRQAPTAQNP
jgi:regulator of sigma E protease